jgi:hypothetical protein
MRCSRVSSRRRAEPVIESARFQYFVASVRLGEGGEVHFLISESERRSGRKISEIVMDYLLPSRSLATKAKLEFNRAKLRLISPAEFKEAHGTRIQCRNARGIEFWRVKD